MENNPIAKYQIPVRSPNTTGRTQHAGTGERRTQQGQGERLKGGQNSATKARGNITNMRAQEYKREGDSPPPPAPRPTVLQRFYISAQGIVEEGAPTAAASRQVRGRQRRAAGGVERESRGGRDVKCSAPSG